jgi:hypothetical protein
LLCWFVAAVECREGQWSQRVAPDATGENVRRGPWTARAAARRFFEKGAPLHGEEVRHGPEIFRRMCAAARQLRCDRYNRAASAATSQLRSCGRQLTAEWRGGLACGGAHLREIGVRRRTFPKGPDED